MILRTIKLFKNTVLKHIIQPRNTGAHKLFSARCPTIMYRQNVGHLIRRVLPLRLNRMKFFNPLFLFIIVLLSVLLFQPDQTNAQIRAGAGFLKVLPGARLVGVSETVTASLDYTHAFYTNPGATGLMREWLWSAAYTKWISDIYNASFLYGRNIRTPWNRHTRFIIGLNQLRIPEFDSSDGKAEPATGNNLLAIMSLGQPINLWSQKLSFGTNVKYFKSQLAGYDANALIFDIGLLYRTPRYNFIKPGNGFLDYAIFSVGAAVTNIGKPIKYLSEGTPLPRIARAGVALNLGSYDGLQLSIASDYRKVRDTDGFFTFGTEFSWRRLFSVCMGYRFEDSMLGNFTFGGSLRIDYKTVKSIIPGRNNALQLDIAANQNSTFVSSPYHGTITHYPISPEKFKFLEPCFNELVLSDSVYLSWEKSADPDLYDDVEHWLLVDRDSLKLAQVLDIADQDKDELFSHLNNESFLVNQQPGSRLNFLLSELECGEYFWTVFAYDRDKHIRFAEKDKRHILKFRATLPKPVIAAINFKYNPWITTDDYQGLLKLTVNNIGELQARNYSLLIYDSTAVPLASSGDSLVPGKMGKVLLSQKPVPKINPGDSTIIDIEWRTEKQGLRLMVAEIVKNSKKTGKDEVINKRSADFYTIAKGTFTTGDSVIAKKYANTIYELPYIGKVYFDSCRSEFKQMYVREWVAIPPLKTFAKRLNEYPHIKVALQGTADLNSNEHGIDLANKRSISVCDSLLALGVPRSQINILPGVSLPARRLPKNPVDALWLLQERRRVDITIENSAEEEMFGPLQTIHNERMQSPVIFKANITAVIPLLDGALQLNSSDYVDSLDLTNKLDGSNFVRDINWELYQNIDESEIDSSGKDAVYSIEISDSLNRRFKIEPQQVYLKTEIDRPKRVYFILAEFGLARPYYDFYWDNLIDRIPFLLRGENKRMRFIGHGCAIGPKEINDRLSIKRARVFQEKFLKDVQEQYPDLFENIKQRIDPPEGLGETVPLTVKSFEGDEILLGDNESSFGRQMNRRVMVMFYTAE